MNFQRRDFLKGSIASLGLGALCSGRIFAAPLGKIKGSPNLAFGVLSDTHFRTDSEWRRGIKSNKYFVAALEYFRARNVDAVVHCGDMADRGLVDELQLHADAWHSVFPDNKLPNGNAVEKLFVSGNHDVDSWSKDMDMTRFVPNKKEWPQKILKSAMAEHWKRIWGEEYKPVWHKVVKGYHFFGQNWTGRPRGEGDEEFMELINSTMSEAGDKKSAPFFFISHDRKYGKFNKEIGRVKGGFGFWGHWHLSAANWGILQMLNASTPGVQCPACPSWWRPDGKWMGGGDRGIVSAPIESKLQGGRWYQGLVVRVYDDVLVIERREFSKGGSIGEDWVMPLKAKTGKSAHPFSRGEIKKLIGAAQFPKGARLLVENISDCDSKSVTVKIPYADGNPKSRVYAYEVTVQARGFKGSAAGQNKLVKAVYAVGCNMGKDHVPNGGVTVFDIPKAELPNGRTLHFSVRPLTSLGTAGKAIDLSCKLA